MMEMIKIGSTFPSTRQKNLNVLRNTIRQQRNYLRIRGDSSTTNRNKKSQKQKKDIQSSYLSQQPQSIKRQITNIQIHIQGQNQFDQQNMQQSNKKNQNQLVQTQDKKYIIQKFGHRYSMSQTLLHQYPSRNVIILDRKQAKQKKKRSKSQLCDPSLPGRTKLQKMKKFSQSVYIQQFKKYQQLNRAIYKNQKLNILHQQQSKIIKKILDHNIDSKKFQSDMNVLLAIFNAITLPKFKINRHQSQQCKLLYTKLLFFIGYQISLLNRSQDDEELKYQLIVSNYHQIYFSMRLKIPFIMMECYEKLIDISIKDCNYVHAQKFAQKCLLASIYYKQKYYQQRCIQKISMCQYYKGNICEATYLHDNNGQVTQQSLKNVRDGYNEDEELQIVFHHLYNNPRFEIEQILKDYDQRMQNYKMLVAFKNPRIDPESSMQSKKKQLKIDIRAMQRSKDFKSQANIIRRQISRHEDLFCVKRILKPNQYKRLLKHKPVINVQNQSSQVLRAHQSFNRVKKINNRGLKNKIKSEFLQFIKKIIQKLQ